MALMISFVCLSVFACASARPIFGNDPDAYLAIKCQADPMWATPSQICRDYLAEFTTPTPHPGTSTLGPLSPVPLTLVPTLPSLVVKSAVLADWAKAILSICSGLTAIYTSVVSYLRFVKKYGLRRAASLGLCGPSQGEDVDASSVPVQISEATV